MGLKKYTKSYDVTKQLAKEKFGKASNSVDSEQTKYTRERLHLIKWILKHTKVAGQDYIHYLESVSEKEQAFGNVLIAMGDEGAIDAAVGDSYGAVGNRIKECASTTKSVAHFTTEHIISPITQLYENDAKQVLDCKHKQEVARLRFEAAQTKMKEYQKKGSKKLADAGLELHESRVNYETLTQDLDTQCNLLIKRMDEWLLPLLQIYTQAQIDHHEKLAAQWRTTQERIAQIAAAPRAPKQFAAPAQPEPAQPDTHAQRVSEAYQEGNPFEPVTHNSQPTRNSQPPPNDGNPFEPQNLQPPQNAQPRTSPSRNSQPPPMPHDPSQALHISPSRNSQPPPPMPQYPSQVNYNPQETSPTRKSQPPIPMPQYPSQANYNYYPSQTSPTRNSQPPGMPQFPTQAQHLQPSQNPPALPPQPSMQNLGQLTPAKSGNSGSNNYPEENDPFQQSVGSQPDPFMQPQPKNIYSK